MFQSLCLAEAGFAVSGEHPGDCESNKEPDNATQRLWMHEKPTHHSAPPVIVFHSSSRWTFGDPAKTSWVTRTFIVDKADDAKNRLDNIVNIGNQSHRSNQREQCNRMVRINLRQARGGSERSAAFRHDVIYKHNALPDIEIGMGAH